MIYERIKDLRVDYGLKKASLACLLGVHRNIYVKYEFGKIKLPTRTLCILADHYNTSVDYLLGRTDQYKPYPKSKVKE